jgi:hypothetical protein
MAKITSWKKGSRFLILSLRVKFLYATIVSPLSLSLSLAPIVIVFREREI